MAFIYKELIPILKEIRDEMKNANEQLKKICANQIMVNNELMRIKR